MQKKGDRQEIGAPSGADVAFDEEARRRGNEGAPPFRARPSGRKDVGALRVRMVAAKNRPCADFPYKSADGKDAEGVILDLDLWLVLPR